jgi:hypothetical protein
MRWHLRIIPQHQHVGALPRDPCQEFPEGRSLLGNPIVGPHLSHHLQS